MKVIVFIFLSLLFYGPGLNAQTVDSNISGVPGEDSAVVKIRIKGATYDVFKNFLPFYILTQKTAYQQQAVPTLIIKKTRVVTEPYAGIIKKQFSAFLTKNFELVKKDGRSAGENMNTHRLYPLRLNEQNQVEELTDYDIKWQTSPFAGGEKSRSASFKSNSVLASGSWYKIGVTESGIYRINRSFLSALGINLNIIDPSRIKVYGNGGKMLPEKNGSFRIDDLEENAIQVVDGGDGKFDNADYFLFYATGPTEWRRNDSAFIKHRAIKNYYSDTSYYFLNFEGALGKRIGNRASSSEPFNVTSSSYDYRAFHEENLFNFAKSGRDFYGESFDVTPSYTFKWSEGDFVVGDTIRTEITVAGNYSEPVEFSISNGGSLNYRLSSQPIIPGQYADYADSETKAGWGLINNAGEIAITVAKVSQRGSGWLDQFQVNARRQLRVNNKQFSFRDGRSAGPNRLCRFEIANPNQVSVMIWNVSDPLNPFNQSLNSSGTAVDFTASADSVNEYCLVPNSDFLRPVYIGKVTNQNLHSITKAEYLIVTHPLFLQEAQRLALFHQKKDGLSYAIATTDQIYNEFSSGRPDVSAIRDFIRMVYTRTTGTSKPLKYVLLMGDGSYNNKNRNLVNNSNLIPTYQSRNSLSSTISITTDDFFGLMDPEEGFNAEDNGYIDLGIGRFTCRTVSEVRAVIAKIENYSAIDANFSIQDKQPANCNTAASESPMGDWRNWLLFLADDEDFSEHMTQSNNLSIKVKQIAPVYNADKIFLDAYQRFSTPGGPRYPDASADFLKRMKKGALIFNYTGHGGEVGLTGERIIDIEIINGLDNFNKLPLFITATCEFSRYDDPSRTSAGELSLLNPKGGAIGLMSTSRLAYSTPNFDLNILLLQHLFSRMPNGQQPRLGDVIRMTKSGLTGGQSYLYANFHLLGDPAMTLAYPQHEVRTTMVNNQPVTGSSSDTLAALSKITISGMVTDTAGNKLTNFNGIVYPTVFDKEQLVSGLLNTPNSSTTRDDLFPFQFKLQKNILYRGKAEVKAGDFSFTFIVPKDISFSPGPGKIYYYATNGVSDAHGYHSQLVVGGDSKNVISDAEGPSIKLYLNDMNFVNGGVTNESPVLYADLTDSSGINTVGTGLGHDLAVILDENTSKPVILNDYYEANLNSYQSGRVRYPFEKLSEGEHRLSFKAWDIQNNSNTIYADFVVAPSAELALEHVLNYPNPFTTRTKFMFQHNQACNPLKVTVQVYTVSGKIVKTINQTVMCEGFRPEGIEWDGCDDFGDKLGRGVYIYRFAILDINNKKAEKIEKLVILN